MSYLYLTDSNRVFASVVLKILVDDQRAGHAERINNSRNIVTMHPSDLVMAPTVVQSNKVKDEVTKLWYIVRNPFQNIRGTRRGNYIVWKLNKSDSPEFKSISEDLYILPFSLKPC